MISGMERLIWTEAECDADAVTKLINQGMDLTQRAPFFNETVLHYWAGVLYFSKSPTNADIAYQEDSLRVVKLLIEKGADLLALDDRGFTPLLVAANRPYCGLSINLKVLDFLLTRKEYSRAEKIEAMELVGAVILQDNKNASLFHVAFDYWRKSLHLRSQMEEEDSGFIEKPRLNLKNVQTIEWNTSAELEDVIEHPDKFIIQSFFVRLRIFSSKKGGVIGFQFGCSTLDDVIRELLHQLRFVEIFDTIWAMLGTQLSRPDLRENESAQWKIGDVVEKLIEVFTSLDKNFPDFVWTKEIIKTSLDLIASAAKFDLPVLGNLIRFVRILSHLPILLLDKSMEATLSKACDRRGRSLLHQAIAEATSDANLHATVRLLLNARCDPNAIDEFGDTPLHFLTHIDEQHFFDDRLNTVAVLLLDFGAKMGRKNNFGQTAVDLLIRKNKRNRKKDEQGIIIGWKLPDWYTELPTLQCLSARVIRRNRIPYLALPASLITMIEKHKLTQ